jgi:hypothetical protein
LFSQGGGFSGVSNPAPAQGSGGNAIMQIGGALLTQYFMNKLANRKKNEESQ